VKYKLRDLNKIPEAVERDAGDNYKGLESVAKELTFCIIQRFVTASGNSGNELVY
jgi:hypothetical protein